MSMARTRWRAWLHRALVPLVVAVGLCPGCTGRDGAPSGSGTSATTGQTVAPADAPGQSVPVPSVSVGIDRRVVEQAAESASSGGEDGVRDGDEVRWHYTIKPAADLRSLSVRACFPGRLPERFDAQMPAARWSLISARRHPGGEVLTQRVDGLDISSLVAGDCVDYTLDLDKVDARADNKRRIRRVERDWYISPDYWLWKPVGGRERVTLTATIVAPEGVALSTPWPYFQRSPDGPDSDVYLIPESTFTGVIPGAISQSPIDYIDVGQTRVRVVRLGDGWKVKRERLKKWLTDAVGAVALLGGIPIDGMQIILLPTPGKRTGYGFATYGGGGTAVLFVGREVTEEALHDDWVAVHEVLHLGMPGFEDASKWLSEGFSTYYEPLLRAKAGMLAPTMVWESIHDGFQRGRKQESNRTLREECVEMRKTYAYQRVYWSGAAILLLADVAARQNGSSLDSEIATIRACCLHQSEWLADNDLLTRTDANGQLITPYLAAAARPYVQSTKFPDVTAAYEALGLSFDKRGKVTMSLDPAHQALREQLTGPEP